MDEKGDVPRAEFLDEEVGEKVIIAREVVHVHNFGGSPFCPMRFRMSMRGGGGYCHRGRRLWERRGRGGDGERGWGEREERRNE
jgi:hypothetical protein